MSSDEKIESFISKLEPFLIIVIISSFVGVLGGVFGAFFLIAIDNLVELRNALYYIVFAMPIIGVLIVYLNKKYKSADDSCKIINKAITKNREIPSYIAPTLYITTALSHFAGASIGKMEAHIKVGGSVGNYISKFFCLNGKYRNTVIASGVSAFFGAVFGLPVTGTILAYELSISKKNKKPIYILPVLLAACFARFICFAFKTNSFIDNMLYIHHADFKVSDIILILLITVACLAFALFFNKLFDYTKDLFNNIKNEYIRIIIGSGLMIGAICLFGNTILCGNDTDLVKKSLDSNSMWYIFIVKALLTSICLAVGFRGGKIGPAFICGATLGILLASLTGINPMIGAAIGAVSLFAGVTGCYISALVLGIELFGFKAIVFYLIIVYIIRVFIKNNYIKRKF